MWRNPYLPANLVAFTEEILNGKFHFLRSASGRSLVVSIPIPLAIFLINFFL